MSGACSTSSPRSDSTPALLTDMMMRPVMPVAVSSPTIADLPVRASVTTRLARAAIRGSSVPRAVLVQQTANVAAMVAALASGDLDLLRRALDDHVAEPVRAPLLRGFTDAKAAALAAGALGCSISGGGPTSFAFASDDASAARIALAMRGAYAAAGVDAETRVARIDDRGARVENDAAGT